VVEKLRTFGMDSRSASDFDALYALHCPTCYAPIAKRIVICYGSSPIINTTQMPKSLW